MTIYLYVKTHRKTGLKYLGKTVKDPHKYPGSGIYWNRHINEHGNDVDTEIIRECITKEELREWGLYYSKLWDVVNAKDSSGNKIWANLVPEEGGMSSETAKEINSRPETKKKLIESTKKTWQDENIRNLRVAKFKEYWSTTDARERQKQRSNVQRRLWADPEYAEKHRKTGKETSRYDHTIYKFIHNSGVIENCTRQELIKKYNLDSGALNNVMRGVRKSTKGWRVVLT